MRKTGLRTSTEVDVILECVKRVEYLDGESTKSLGVLDDSEMTMFDSPNEVALEIWLLGEFVIKAIFSNFVVFYSNNFCNTLGKVACVPAEKGFPNVGGKKGRKRVLCSYSEAILLKDWPLAWSCSRILSWNFVIPPEYSGATPSEEPSGLSNCSSTLVGKNLESLLQTSRGTKMLK